MSKRTYKDPEIAGFLSFLAPGAGQVFNDDLKKGLILLVASTIAVLWGWKLAPSSIFGIWLFFIIWIYAVYDAYAKARAVLKKKK